AGRVPVAAGRHVGVLSQGRRAEARHAQPDFRRHDALHADRDRVHGHHVYLARVDPVAAGLPLRRLKIPASGPRRAQLRSRVFRPSQPASRRKFLLAAGAAAAGTATVAAPQVSRAQTTTWKYQSTWSTKDIFHEFAIDYAKRVNDMTGGRLKLEVLAAGA